MKVEIVKCLVKRQGTWKLILPRSKSVSNPPFTTLYKKTRSRSSLLLDKGARETLLKKKCIIIIKATLDLSSLHYAYQSYVVFASLSERISHTLDKIYSVCQFQMVLKPSLKSGRGNRILLSMRIISQTCRIWLRISEDCEREWQKKLLRRKIILC